MPSPFPGMDPYLEHPARWPGVHQGLIAAIRISLNAVLPRGYVADAGERLYVAEPGRSIYPDALVIEQFKPERGARSTRTGVAAPDAPWLIIAEPEEFREPYIEILLAADPGTVVTVLELLSPANKSAGHTGRTKYLEKQQELLASRVSLVEIDLLRAGEHTVAAPLSELQRRGRWDYLVSLHRGGRGSEFEVWPVQLAEPLPLICIPLAPGEADVFLDLQATFDRFYDENAYERRIDYGQPATPPLAGADAAWAQDLLSGRDPDG